MKYQSHLALEELDLPASTEWEGAPQCWRMVRLAEGRGYWLRQGEAREVNPGDVLVVPPGRAGLFRASQLGGARLQSFGFCPELMSGLLTMMERQSFHRLAGKLLQPVQLFPASHRFAEQFAGLCSTPELRNGLWLRSQMLGLIGSVFARELAPAKRSEVATLSATKRIQVLLQHLTEEEFLSASSESLAAYCGCSLRHFSRLFLQHFGVSLRSRQIEMRLVKAQRLLAETDSRVMTVAASCGYRHLGVFNQLFKKRFGMTPSKWRREAVHPPGPQNGCNLTVASPSPKPGRNGSSGGQPS
jgi:AraC-like DNA-binding protein